MSTVSTRRLVQSEEALDWEFATAETRELTHAIHRYSGKFIPQVARQAIELLTGPGDLVLDPYCGSGTTLLEAMLTGRRAVGVDLNPLAVLISTVKVTPVAARDLERLWIAASELPIDAPSGEAALWSTEPTSPGAGDPRRGDEWFVKWFPADVLDKLITIDRFTDGIEDLRLANISRLAMSDILRKVSRAHQGFPNVMFDRKRESVTASVRAEYLGRLRSIIDAVASLERAVSGRQGVSAPGIIHGRAEESHLADGTVDAVISHPPYIGSVPYAEYGALSLRWLGHDPKALDRELTGGKRQSSDVVERFQLGYAGMLSASTRALKQGGHVFLLTGNPTVRGTVVDLAAMTGEIARALGLDLVYTSVRKGINRRANKMDAETVTVWRKSQA